MNLKRGYVGYHWFVCLMYFHAVPATAQSVVPSGQNLKCQIFDKVNAYRFQNNKVCLRRNRFLDKAAQNYAAWFARNLTQNSNVKFGHNSDGRNPTQRAQAAGYKAKPNSVKKYVTKRKLANGNVVTRTVRKITNHKFVGENILYFEGGLCQPNKFVKAAFTGWKNSKAHKRNMLLPGWNATGLGFAINKKSKRCFAVQVFGKADMRQGSPSCRAKC